VLARPARRHLDVPEVGEVPLAAILPVLPTAPCDSRAKSRTRHRARIISREPHTTAQFEALGLHTRGHAHAR
jgi:hypothetical protein